jgi:hypothetical protein
VDFLFVKVNQLSSFAIEYFGKEYYPIDPTGVRGPKFRRKREFEVRNSNPLGSAPRRGKPVIGLGGASKTRRVLGGWGREGAEERPAAIKL